jgi:hypothetical protein
VVVDDSPRPEQRAGMVDQDRSRQGRAAWIRRLAGQSRHGRDEERRSVARPWPGSDSAEIQRSSYCCIAPSLRSIASASG